MTVRFLPAFLLLAGCAAQQGGFPSLAPRAIESVDVAAEPAVPGGPAVAADPVLSAAAGETLAAVQASTRNFATALAEAEGKVRAASAAASGSDRWVEAQVALSRLQAALRPAADALQSLDDRRAAIGDGPVDPALEAARQQVATLVAAQQAEVSRLEALLPR